jgi:precorrin-2 dehydrogenase/sirohydrochlorin ferrochelatase
MYPISLRLSGKRCCVVGGGRVAERKVAGLLNAGASVLVISPQLTERLAELKEMQRIEVLLRPYADGDLEQVELVFAATDSEAVNLAVCREAERRGIWVNDAMSPERSTFHLPAVLRRGELMIAVSTGGAGPRLSRRIRDELAAVYSEAYERYVRFIGRLRQHLGSLAITAEERLHIYEQVITERERFMSLLERVHSEQQLNELVRETVEMSLRHGDAEEDRA